MASDATAEETLVVHTAQLVLSPQNFLAFREHLSALWTRGEREQFWAFWVVCPLVEHLPPPDVPIFDIPLGEGAIPVRRIVCTQAGCARCESGRGGYQSPSWGHGAGVLFWFRLVWGHKRPGKGISAMLPSWTPRDGVVKPRACTWSRCFRQNGGGCFTPPNITVLQMPTELQCQTSLPCGGLGRADKRHGGIPCWLSGLHGLRPLPVRKPEPFAVSGHGLTGQPGDTMYRPPVSSAATGRTSIVIHAASSSAPSALAKNAIHIEARAAEKDPGRGSSYEACSHACQFCDCGRAGRDMPGFRRLGFVSWLRASALGLASLLAMRDDMGVYAAEALQSQEEGSAYRALERQARARPAQWRQQNGYLRDSDFAFAFSSY